MVAAGTETGMVAVQHLGMKAVAFANRQCSSILLIEFDQFSVIRTNLPQFHCNCPDMPCIECLVSPLLKKIRMQQPPKQIGLETEKTSRLERMLQIGTPNKIFEDMAVSQPCMGLACAKQIVHAGTGLGMIEESTDEDFESKSRLEEPEVRRALQEIADDKLETGFGFSCESILPCLQRLQQGSI